MCKVNKCNGCDHYSYPSKTDTFKPHCMNGLDVNTSDECTEYKKEFVGTVCGHHDQILAGGDAYMVEFSDVCGDVCEYCFIETNTINACDCTPETDSPYKGNLTDYWYKGTLAKFKSDAETNSKSYYDTNTSINVIDDIVECLLSDVDAYTENIKGLAIKGLITNPQLVQEYKEWFKL